MKQPLISTVLLFPFNLVVQAQSVIRLYTSNAPSPETRTWDEARSTKNRVNTRIIYNVSTPTLAYLLLKGLRGQPLSVHPAVRFIRC